MTEWMDDWRVEQVDDEQLDGWVNEWVDSWMYGLIGGWIYDEWMYLKAWMHACSQIHSDRSFSVIRGLID